MTILSLTEFVRKISATSDEKRLLISFVSRFGINLVLTLYD
jgi:hypothetical protein